MATMPICPDCNISTGLCHCPIGRAAQAANGAIGRGVLHAFNKRRAEAVSKYGKLHAVDIPAVERKLVNVLERETLRLLETSKVSKLSGVESKSLIEYLKLVKAIKIDMKKETDSLSEAELERIAAQKTSGQVMQEFYQAKKEPK